MYALGGMLLGTVLIFASQIGPEAFWSNPQLKPLLIELMPGWIGSQVADGQPLEAAVIQDFLQDQPMIKFPYFTLGEVDAGQIRAFIASCNELTFTP